MRPVFPSYTTHADVDSMFPTLPTLSNLIVSSLKETDCSSRLDPAHCVFKVGFHGKGYGCASISENAWQPIPRKVLGSARGRDLRYVGTHPPRRGMIIVPRRKPS